MNFAENPKHLRQIFYNNLDFPRFLHRFSGLKKHILVPNQQLWSQEPMNDSGIIPLAFLQRLMK